MPTKLHTSKWLWWCILCYTYFTVIFFKELSKIKASAKEKRKLSKSFSLLCKENMKSLPRSTNPNTLWPLDTSLISPHPPSAPHFPLTALHSHTSLVFTPQGCDLTSEAPNPPGILFPQLFKWIVPFRPLGHLLWEAPPPPSYPGKPCFPGHLRPHHPSYFLWALLIWNNLIYSFTTCPQPSHGYAQKGEDLICFVQCYSP